MELNNINMDLVLTVREVRKITTDVSPMVDVIFKNFEYLTKFPDLKHNKSEIRRLLLNRDMMGLFVYHNNKMVAYLVGEHMRLSDGRYVYYISYMYVSPKYRGKKIGSQILNMLMDKCKQNNMRYIVLTCDRADKRVCEFYIKRGFKVDSMLKTDGRHEVLIYFIE